MKPQSRITDLPIQVKALAPILREKDPDLWKCNTLKECIERMHMPFTAFKRDATHWILEFKIGSIAGEFLSF